jgi:hypothetical protein
MSGKSRNRRAEPAGKRQEPSARRPSKANTRIAAQVRKILRTHYASKYRVR